MRGIVFNNLPPASPSVSSRMDVACFIGFVPLKKKPLMTDTLKQWLREYGWDEKRLDEFSNHPQSIRNTPVPLESWEAFQAVFDDKRLDRLGTLQSRQVSEPLDIDPADHQLHVIVDRRQTTIALQPDENHQLSFRILTAQINDQLTGARAFVRPLDQGGRQSYRLVIQRTDETAAGEITVYTNQSLGFPEAQQDDTFYLQNYVAAAIKAFFRQGGEKCYLISMGNPLPHDANEKEKVRQAFNLLWGEKPAASFLGGRLYDRSAFLRLSLPDIPNAAYPVEQWQGLSHLAALPDVTYVCFPDLVDLSGTPRMEIPKAPERTQPEIFVVCSQTAKDPSWSYTDALRVPECSKGDFKVWNRLIEVVLDYLNANSRTVQLVVSLPMPDRELRQNFNRFILEELLPGISNDGSKYQRLQLAFPWIKSQQSGSLPQSLEPPEGNLIGLLARQALSIGAFRSIAGSLLDAAYDLAPQDIDAYSRLEQTGLSFADRVCWIDFVPDGIALQSDVTAVLKDILRYGAARRIMILIQRAALQVGLDHVFDPSSERIWLTVEDSLNDLLQDIYQNNGLRGRSSTEAYSVVCDRSTMTQSDIDNGRLIANISIRPAVPIQQIAVDLLVERDGRVTFRSALQ